MKHQPGIFNLSKCTILLVSVAIVLIAFLFPTPAYADNCLDDITNLADCMRTPVIREAITISASLLGVTPLVLVNFLGNLGALNPLPNFLPDLFGKEGIGELLIKVWEKIKPVIERLSPDLVKRIERSVARKTGADLAKKSSAIIDFLNKSSKSGSGKAPVPQKAKPPVKKAAGSSSSSGSGGSGGAGVKSRSQYTKGIKDLKVEVFDSEDAHKILQALKLVKSTVPPDGSMPVTRAGLDGLLGQHPSNNPIIVTLKSGKTVIINSVKGIAFDSPGKSPGGDPGILDFKKGVSIAAEVVEPAPPTAPPGPGPAPAGKAVGGGKAGGAGPAGPGKTGGGAAPGGGASGQAAPGGKKGASLLGKQPDQPASSGGKSPAGKKGSGGGKGGSGGKKADGSIIDKGVSSATDDF